MECQECIGKSSDSSVNLKDPAATQKLLDAFPFYAMLVDENHCIIAANRKVYEVLQKSPEELRGAYCPQVVHGMNAYPGCPLQAAIESGVPQEQDLYDRNRHIWLKAIMYPTELRTEKGLRVYLHLVPVITEEKQRELALRESEQRYKTLFDKGHDAVFVFKIEDGERVGGLIDVNDIACELTGFTKEEVLGSSLEGLGLIVGDLDSRALLEELRLNECINGRSELRGSNGLIVSCEFSLHLFELQGQSSVLVIARDLRERQQVESERLERFEAMKRSMESTIKTVSMIGEMRDMYTSGHQQRVSKLACAIAKEMDLSHDSIESIRIAGLLHDIGKIAIPSEILSKPGRICEAEFEIIKTHSQVGYEILKIADFAFNVAEIVRQHHERLDGSGYPLGLSSDDIMLESRILAVADVIEAMSSRRPYREALGVETALAEIQARKGVLFDTAVVEACKKIFDRKEVDFFENKARNCHSSDKRTRVGDGKNGK